MPALDFSPLLSAVDEQTLVIALLAVGAIMIAPRVARMGVDWIKVSIDDGGSSVVWEHGDSRMLHNGTTQRRDSDGSWRSFDFDDDD